MTDKKPVFPFQCNRCGFGYRYGWTQSAEPYHLYRNTAVTVKDGNLSSPSRKFACKDFVAVLIEYVLTGSLLIEAISKIGL